MNTPEIQTDRPEINARDKALGLLHPGELRLSEAHLQGQLHALAAQKLTESGVVWLDAPLAVRKAIFDLHAPREDTVTLTESVRSRGGKNIFEGLVLPPEHTLNTTLRIIADKARLASPCCVGMIGGAWRAEPGDTEKMRWFSQINRDLFDWRDLKPREKQLQDVEAIIAMNDVLRALLESLDPNAPESRQFKDYEFRVSHRKIIEGTLLCFGITHPENVNFVISALDKVESITLDKFEVELPQRLNEQARASFKANRSPITFTQNQRTFLCDLRKIHGKAEDVKRLLTEQFKKIPSEGLNPQGLTVVNEGSEYLYNVLSHLEARANQRHVKAYGDIRLGRPCRIYNEIEYEVYLPANPYLGSLGGGGRFDLLSEEMAGFKMNAVGWALGSSRLRRAIFLANSSARIATADVLVVLANTQNGYDNATFEEAAYHADCVHEVSEVLRQKGWKVVDWYSPLDTTDLTNGEAINFAANRRNKIRYVYLIEPGQNKHMRIDLLEKEKSPIIPDLFNRPLL